MIYFCGNSHRLTLLSAVTLVLSFCSCDAKDGRDKAEGAESRLESLELEARRLLRADAQGDAYRGDAYRSKSTREAWDRAIEACIGLYDEAPQTELGLRTLQLAHRLASRRALRSKEVLDHRYVVHLAALLRAQKLSGAGGESVSGIRGESRRVGGRGERLPSASGEDVPPIPREGGGAEGSGGKGGGEPRGSNADGNSDVVTIEGHPLTGVVVNPKVVEGAKRGRRLKSFVCSTSHSRAQIVLHFDGVPAYEYGVLQPSHDSGHGRLFLDFKGVDMSKSAIAAMSRCGGSVINKVRRGSRSGGVDRIVFEITAPASFHLLPPADHSLLLNVVRSWPSGDVVAIRRVALDPGHGGKHEGAVGPGGTKEKDVVLRVAKSAAKRLRSSRIDVVLTRTRDKTLLLEERTATAIAAGADLFVSIHANAEPQPESPPSHRPPSHRPSRPPPRVTSRVTPRILTGPRSITGGTLQAVETYFLNTGGDDYNRRLTERENETNGKTGSFLWGKLLDRKLVMQSKMLAQEVHPRVFSIVKAHLPETKDGGIRTALFHVLMNARMPGILVELSYLSHKKGESFLRRRKNQDLLGRALAAGIIEFVKKHNSNATLKSPDLGLRGGGSGGGSVPAGVPRAGPLESNRSFPRLPGRDKVDERKLNDSKEGRRNEDGVIRDEDGIIRVRK